ncbi:MAG: hypothetical protein LBC58_03055 [Clostridiales Family XIII bacterium]|jgi:hypothetical protein|nr:hypothetical protein [Clostridiales Family XIII bacterium]
MRVLEFIADSSEIIAPIVFGCLVIPIIIRIIYSAIKYPGAGKATATVRDVFNIYDPITGMPRMVVDKEPDVAVIEEWQRRETEENERL